MKDFLGVLGENFGLAGVVLLLNRRDKRYSCSFVTRVDRLMLRSRVTYSEGGTRDKGTRSQLDELWIYKTDTVIV